METEILKQKIKITDLASSLGITLKSGKALCLWHDETTPSLSFDDAKGIFKCFGCGETGDAITLYQKIKGVSFIEACEALGGQNEKPIQVTNKPDHELYLDLIEHLFAEGRGEAVDAYLEKRGITEETANKFMLAGIKDLEKTKKYLLEKYGIEKLKKAGLISSQGFLFSSHPLIIPVVANGQIVSLRGRSLDDRKIKYLQAVGIPLPIFNADEQGEIIYLAEGEFDAMTLSQLSVTAYGICGTNGFKDEFKKHFIDKDVVLVFDNDEAGKKATKGIASQLQDTANSISSLSLPDGKKDINECLTGGVDVLALPIIVIKEGIRILHLADIAEEQRKEMSLTKMPIGFTTLDDAFQGGLRPGNAVIVAAVSGEGKTALMQTISYHYAKQDIVSLWFSYEETMSELWERFEKMGVGRQSQMFAPFDLEDSKIDFIEKVIERQKKKMPFFVVFIDQLFNLFPKIDGKSVSSHLTSNHSLYLGQMSTQLKAIAMKHKIIIFTAHQLSKEGELSYSTMVRNAPDKVIFLKREEDNRPNKTDVYTDKTILKINKNRPYGTRPIYQMTVADGRFVPYGTSDMVAKAERILTQTLI